MSDMSKLDPTTPIPASQPRMTTDERVALHLLSELLVQIRGIAGDAVRLRHVSALGPNQFDPAAACAAIYGLADAAHNLPGLIATDNRAHFLWDGAMKDISDHGARVFGPDTPFAAFLRLGQPA